MTADNDNQATSPDSLPRRLLSRTDWVAFGIAFVFSLSVYTYTLAPSVTLEDSGELVTAAQYLGVPHPPGYPIWTMVSWLFTKIFAFMHFRGYPNPAWGVNFCSAFFGALAVGITAILGSCSARSMLLKMPGLRNSLTAPLASLIACGGAITSALLLAFTPGLWSQCVIAEVYALNSFFLALILLLLYLWMQRPENTKLLFVTAFIYGLGLTNHQTLGVIVLAFGTAILLKDPALFRDLAVVGSVFLAGIMLMKITAVSGVAQQLLSASQYGLFGGLLLALLLLCFLLSARKHWEISAVLFLGCLTAFVFLATNIQDVKPMPDSIPWGLYTALFFAQLGVVAILCFALPKGKTFAACVCLLELLLAILLRQGAVHGLVHPTSPWFYFYLFFLNFLVLALGYYLLPRGRTVFWIILLIELGLAFYIYLPLSSETNPPMNWGYPRTWEGFKHAISRGQYEKISPAHVLSTHFLDQIGSYLSDLRRQFTLMVALIGFLPFSTFRINVRGRTLRVFYVALSLATTACLLIGIEWVTRIRAGASAAHLPIMSGLYRSLALLVIVLFGIGVLARVAREVLELIRKLRGEEAGVLEERVTVGVVLGGSLLALVGTMGFLFIKLTSPDVQLSMALKIAVMMGALGLPFLTLLLGILMHMRILELETDVNSEKWMLVTFLAFVSLSLVLVVVLNPKQDIQSLFINRVFFITSHSVYALWIGYGITLSLAFIHLLLKMPRVTKTLGTACVALVPLLPILNNWKNQTLVDHIGGAEQNGHEFGWHFGHYQLCGAKAITAELGPNDEPLPNPEFPPAMGRDAVFFGGTDPGRFVPTYQIFGPKDRPDVSLITQNALADNTYMSVMRDLYGDKIWIPAIGDSNLAFKEYVEGVRNGTTPRSAAVKVKDGRVSVQGVQGVMEINGLLAKMIFEHNKYKHPFYVEESYVIQWMYPYLIPHGLIMEIQPEPLSKLTDEMVKNDHEFWDWYVRRLLNNPKFTRDVVARKSFSKLRGAIAGVYVWRRLYKEAEFAFKQAKQLYPLSPEANFRLADLYVRQNRLDDGRAVIRAFLDKDTGNEKAKSFLNSLDQRAKLGKRRQVLEQKLLSQGKASVSEVLELATIYLRVGQGKKFQGLTLNLLNNANTPPQTCLQVAQLYANAKQPKLLRVAFKKYLERAPRNAKVWADLAAVSLMLKEKADVLPALQNAVKYGGRDMKAALQKDPRFNTIRNDPPFRALVGTRHANALPLGPRRPLSPIPGMPPTRP